MTQFENFTTAKPEQNRAEKINRQYELGQALYESGAIFSWPGIDPAAHRRLKNDEEEFPGYATPIDELIERCENEGIKVLFNKSSRNKEIYIVPALSTDVQNDSIFAKHLQVDAFMDGDLSELIVLSR